MRDDDAEDAVLERAVERVVSERDEVGHVGPSADIFGAWRRFHRSLPTPFGSPRLHSVERALESSSKGLANGATEESNGESRVMGAL